MNAVGSRYLVLLGILLAAQLGCGQSASDPPGGGSSLTPGSPTPGDTGPDAVGPDESGPAISEAAGAEINLFQHFDIRKNTNRGAAELRDDGLHFTNAAGGCQVFFPDYDPPAEFDLEARVTRTHGDGAIIFGFYAWGQQARVVLDGDTDDGPVSGLAPIDGHWLNQPGYPNGIQGPLLVNDRPATVLVQVRRDALVVTLDGRQIFEYRGTLPTLGRLRFYTTPAPRAFSIASWKSKYDIPRLVVRPVEETSAKLDAVVKRADGPTPRDPTPREPVPAGPPEFQFAKLPLDPSQWAFAFRQATGDRWAIDDPRARLQAEADGLQVRAASQLSTIMLAYRPRLQGDFLIQLQILTPPRGDPDTQTGGGTSVPYLGFRTLDPEGRDVTYHVPAPTDEPQRSEYRIRRQGDVLTGTRNGEPLPEQTAKFGETCHLFLQLNGPAKLWIQGHAASGGVGSVCYGPGQYTSLEPSADAWFPIRPGTDGVDSQNAPLGVEGGGLRVDNPLNEPLQLRFHRPLRGDFHVTGWLDVLSVSLVQRSRSSLQKLYVDLGFTESGQKQPQLFPISRYGEQDSLRFDLIRERGELRLFADGQRCGSLRNAADGSLTLQLQKAGSIRLRDLRVDADQLLAPVPAPLASDSPPATPAPSPAPEPKQEPTPPRLDRQDLVLPGPYTDVAAGAGGRCLFFYMPSQDKLAVLDLAERRLTHFLPVAGPDARFAAGQDKLIVVIPSQKLIQRWDIATWKREVTATLAFDVPPTIVAMGAASQGPVLIAGGDSFRGELQLLNLGTLQPISLEGRNPPGMQRFSVGDKSRVRVSANGRVFTTWRTDVSPAGFFVMLLNGNRVQELYDHDTAGYLAPSPDGQRIYTPRGIYTQQIKLVMAQPANAMNFPVPAVQGDWYLRVGGQALPGHGSRMPPSMTLHRGNQDAAIVGLYGVENIGGDFADRSARDAMALDKRCWFAPDQGVLAILPKTDERVELYDVDLERLLLESGEDYLLVTSKPPSALPAGGKLEYPMQILSKHGGVACSLASGPDGMQVTPDGLVTWTAPNQADDQPEHAIVLVRDSTGQETYHTFSLTVGTAGSSRSPHPAPPGSSAASPAAKLPLRTWTDVTGKFRVQARMVRVDGDVLFLENEHGEPKSVPLSRLSRVDQAYVRQESSVTKPAAVDR